MLLGFKTKLKLNNQQKTLMAQHCGYARWVFNQKVANLRRDYLHKITSYLAKNCCEIVIGYLNLSEMLANRKLAKAISELGLNEWRRQLEYKCEIYRSKWMIVDRWFPGPKTYSGCGLLKGKLSLSERVYRYKCGLEMDRDLNMTRVLASQAVG